MKARFMILALAFGACAGSPGPGEPGYDYNLTGSYVIDVEADDGTPYAGTLQLETLPGGEIVGSMSLTDPVPIEGEMTGMVIGAEASLTMAYEIVGQGCGGTFEGTAVIDAGGTGAVGSMDMTEDGCGGSPTHLTLTLTRN